MNNVVTVLKRIIDAGLFKPQVNEWLQSIRQMPESFYSRIKSGEGLAAAEVALEKQTQHLFLREFSASLEGVARGVLALAHADSSGEYVSLVDDPQAAIEYPSSLDVDRRARKLIVARNPSLTGCGCSLPAGYAVWGRNGSMRLRSVVISFHEPTKSLGLDLVLPLPQNQVIGTPSWQGMMLLDGYVVVRIARSGFATGERRTFTLDRQEDFLFERHVGIAKATPLPINGMTTSGGYLGDQVGFPGADEYIARHLPELGAFLSAVAGGMGSKHTHKE